MFSYKRVLAVAVSAAWVAGGIAGAYVYAHHYAIYRGFAVPETPDGIPQGTVEQVAFHSRLVTRGQRYLVYLPPGYADQAAQGRRFPVLYLLHGVPGKFTVFTNVAAVHVDANVLLARHRMRPMIIVMPAGDQGTLRGDTEWANTGAGRWEDFVLEVVHDVDHRFATIPDRRGRAIAGDSEGAYGAVNVALHHLDVFSAAQSWGGYFTQTPTGPFAGASAAALRANSPAAYVPGLAPEIRRLGFRAWLYQGRTDTLDPARLRDFSAELHAAGADVRYAFFPGGHDWGLFRAKVPRMLRVASRWFGEPPRGRAVLRGSGRSLSLAALRRVIARRHARCLALVPGPGVHIGGACRRYRARVAG